jgi:hypothetical protein
MFQRPNQTLVKSDYHSDPTWPPAQPKAQSSKYTAQTTISSSSYTLDWTHVDIIYNTEAPQDSRREEDRSKECQGSFHGFTTTTTPFSSPKPSPNNRRLVSAYSFCRCICDVQAHHRSPNPKLQCTQEHPDDLPTKAD